MATKKMTNDEIDKRIEQLKNLKKENTAKEIAQERKARSHRLIQVGAAFEKHFGTTTAEDAEGVIKKLYEFTKKHMEDNKKQVGNQSKKETKTEAVTVE